MSDLVIDALTAAGVAGQTTVRVELTDNRSNPVPGYVIGESDVIVAPIVSTTDADGHVVIDLIPNADINPPNTIYTVTVGDKQFTILKSGASQTLFEALIEDPPPLDPIPSSDFLRVDNNLSDVASAPASRTSLGLGNSATKDVGTVAGSVAAGDHIHAASAVTVVPFSSIAATNVQDALEEVLLEANPPASGVSFTPAGDIVSTNVQAAVVEVDAELHAHETLATDAHDASAISFVPGTGIASTDVQSAIVEAKTDSQTFSTAYTDAHISDPTAAHAASAIGFTPTGTIAATDAQAAIAEVATEAAADLTAHVTDTTAAHLASAIDYTPTFVLDTTNVQDGLSEISETFATQAVPSGFPNTTSTTLSIVDSGANLTFTIAPTGATFDIWLLGDKFTKTTETVTMTDATAVYYIYYTSAGVLTATSYVSQPAGFIWASQIPVAIVYRGTTNNDLALFDTRHGLTMDWASRAYLHTTRGTQLGTGLALSNYVLSPGSPVNADNQWSMTTGTLYNEDITYTVPAISAGGPYTTLYRTGTTEFTTLTSLATTLPFALSGSDIAYNLNTAGSYSLAAVPSGSFVNYYIFCTGSQTTGYKTFAYPDSTYYATQALAEAAPIVSPFTPGGFAYSEFFMRYRVTYQRSNAYTTTGRCRTTTVTAIAASQTLITGATPTDHAVLTGRSTVDSHPASAITFTPAGTIAATNAQTAIAEVATDAAADLAAHIANGTGAHAATAISFSPTGTIAATNTQTAIAEVATDAAAAYVPKVGSYAAVGTDVFESRVTGNAVARFTLDTDGTHNWGDGTLAQDTNLYRSATDTLKTDDSFHVGTRIGAGTAPTASGRIALAAGTTAADGILFGTDTNLYRYAADTLRTDDGMWIVAPTAVGSQPPSTTEAFNARTDTTSTTAPMTPFKAWHVWQPTLDSTAFVTASTSQVTAVIAAATTWTNGAEAGIAAHRGSISIQVDGTAAGIAVGFTAGVSKFGAGTLTRFSSMVCSAPAVSTGTIATAIGMEIQAQKASGVTLGYGVYSRGSTDLNRFDGSVGIGGIDPSSAKLVFAAATTAAGGILFGTDTNLYRSAADVLSTDDSFRASHRLTDPTGTQAVNHQLSGFVDVTAPTGTAVIGVDASLYAGTGSSNLTGTLYGFQCLTGAFGAYSGTLAVASALVAGLSNFSTGVITQGYGLRVTGPNGSGTFTSITGARIENQGSALVGTAIGLQVAGTSGSTTNIGVGIAAATTNTLWISSNTDSTTEAGGIVFGSSKDTNLYRLAANVLATDDSIALNTAGGGVKIKEGSNATSGVATMAAGAVVVPTTKVTASSRIQLCIQSLGTVTVPKAIGVTARTAGTSFTITSADATDTSVVAWVIIEPA